MKGAIVLLAAASLLAAGAALAVDPQEIGKEGSIIDDKPFVPPAGVEKRALDCSGAQDLPCNGSVQSTTVGLPNNAALYNCVGWNESGGEEVWRLVLAERRNVVATLTTGGCDLDLFLLSACDATTCFRYGSTGFTQIVEPGTYYLVVDGYNGASCSYTLTLTCQDPDPGSICVFENVCYNWDFRLGDWGFTTAACGATGGPAPWQYGATTLPGAPGNVWATNLTGNYNANAGEGLLSPPFTVGPGCDYMEIKHYFRGEGSGAPPWYDGGNVTVNDVVITPVEGYDGTARTSPHCVATEAIYGGKSTLPSRNWSNSCFDLSEFEGQTIQVRFDFGSDGSVQYPGWYIAYVRLGSTTQPIPAEEQSWGTVKSLYR